MTNEKILKSEILNEESLDKVSGGITDILKEIFERKIIPTDSPVAKKRFK